MEEGDWDSLSSHRSQCGVWSISWIGLKLSPLLRQEKNNNCHIIISLIYAVSLSWGPKHILLTVSQYLSKWMHINIPVCSTETEGVKWDLFKGIKINVIISFPSFIFVWFFQGICVCKRTLHVCLLQTDACFLGIVAWYANQELWEMEIPQAEWIFCGLKGIHKLIANLPYDTVVK